MGKQIILCGLLALVGVAGSVQAQPGLGTPVAAEPAETVDAGRTPRFPLLNSITRTLFAPNRGAGPLLPPQPVETTPTREDIARMVADGTHSQAEILAAKIKMDEAQAKPRQAAVRYLASVDCHYYPEAETGLIAALRADRIESVRYEAALAMATCKGTTSAMLEALHVASMGMETDGNPAETSERVRAAARSALNHALSSNMSMYPYAPPMTTMMMPGTEWFPPEYAYQPAIYPMPYYPLAVQPVSPEERLLAETVGLPPRIKAAAATPAPTGLSGAHTLVEWIQSSKTAAPPGPTSPSGSRSFIEWIQKLAASREPTAGETAGRSADPRMRGLVPLGSETTLAIPAAHAAPVQPYPIPSNND